MDIITDIRNMDEDERWQLIMAVASLARHCNWGVDPVFDQQNGHNVVAYNFTYYESVRPIADLAAHAGDANWRPDVLYGVCGGGPQARYESYKAIAAMGKGVSRLRLWGDAHAGAHSHAVSAVLQSSLSHHSSCMPRPSLSAPDVRWGSSWRTCCTSFIQTTRTWQKVVGRGTTLNTPVTAETEVEVEVEVEAEVEVEFEVEKGGRGES
jgi:hypothetical protein